MSESHSSGTPETLAHGRYVLSRRLGVGASAVVWQAHDGSLGVERAVKVLHGQGLVAESVRKRLQAEAQAMARLDHRHVLRVYDIGEDEGRAFVVMDLATGGNLGNLVDENGPLSEAVALRYTLQVLSALAAAHAEGIVHRDVKPQNVLLDDKGMALLGDFGIALHATDGSHRDTRTGMALGTMAFMAPEQRLDARSVGPPADLYAVGATLFYLITADNPVDLFAVDGTSDRWRGISDPVRELLVKATRYETANRYATAAEMARDIVDALATEGAVHEDPLDPRQFPSPSSRLSTSARNAVAAPTLDWQSREWDAATTDAITTLLHEAPPLLPVARPRTIASGPSRVTTAEWTDMVSRRYLPLLVVLLGLGAVIIISAVTLRPFAEQGPTDEALEPEPVAEPVEVVAPMPADVGPAPTEVAPAPIVAPAPGVAPAQVGLPLARPAPAPEPSVAPVSAGPPPLGVWTGTFNGRPAVFSLSGALDHLEGTVSVRFGTSEVRTAVRGTFDPDSRALVLEDEADSIDAGRYVATLSADGGSLDGKFEGLHNGRLAPFFLRPGP